MADPLKSISKNTKFLTYTYIVIAIALIITSSFSVIVSFLTDNSVGGINIEDIIYIFLLFLILLILILSIHFLRNFISQKEYKRTFQYMVILEILIISITFIHDIALFLEVGNFVGGALTMTHYFILDIVSLVLLLIFFINIKKENYSKYLVACGGLLCIIVLICSLGEIVAYPLNSITDFDEFLLVFSIFFISVVQLSYVYLKLKEN